MKFLALCRRTATGVIGAVLMEVPGLLFAGAATAGPFGFDLKSSGFMYVTPVLDKVRRSMGWSPQSQE